MRRAGPELLSLALMDARNHTLHLFGQYQNALEAVDFKIPQTPELNPPLWMIGHVAWFQERWIGRNLQRALGSRCPPGQSRLASMEPNADRWWDPEQAPHDARWTLALPLPGMGRCRTYLLDTLECTLELLEKAGTDDDALYFYRLCLFHEDLQDEAFTCMAQTLGLSLERPLQTAFTPAPMALREPLLIPATTWQVGSPSGAGTGFSFDNERPVHAISVPEFEIDAQAVTWAQYVEFVGDGGYDQPAFWHPDGWQWLQALAAGEGEGRRGPRYVEQIGIGSGAVIQTRFGQPMRMQGTQPAMHLSWWEADAWCRWAGRRLPAEVEWEAAAHTAARRGFRWGDVWEWTGTTFRPYPGFAPDPWRAYSEPSFGTHKVLRGASFATRARLKHPNFRNFCRPERDDIFCGFRSCAL
ncbi:MAG: ergothioneine biosynthesis protein EgtB [Burkholderiales bacterium]|nr:ergothioneine biosynthesis protein EgtB [Burkholderiales bacterium]